MTREPGGTALGEVLREILLHQKMDLETEALLMFAARREHLAQVIEPALARGDWVLSRPLHRRDLRLSGRRPRPAARQARSAGALGAGRFSAGPDGAVRRAARNRQRAAQRRARTGPFESESDAFFTRTRAEYLRRAEEAPYRFAIIDSTQSIERIQKRLEELIATL